MEDKKKELTPQEKIKALEAEIAKLEKDNKIPAYVKNKPANMPYMPPIVTISNDVEVNISIVGSKDDTLAIMTKMGFNGNPLQLNQKEFGGGNA